MEVTVTHQFHKIRMKLIIIFLMSVYIPLNDLRSVVEQVIRCKVEPEAYRNSLCYFIIKCINTFNREETDANKIKIVEERREEVFGQEYDAFVASLTRTLNEDLWKKVAFVKNEEVTTRDFFDIYNQYFG